MLGRIRILGCFAVVMLFARGAVADPAAGDACARSLSPEALQVYHAAAPDLRPDTKIADLLREKVRPMVASGQIARGEGRAAAEAAAGCLQARRR